MDAGWNETGLEERRRQQVELYGESVDVLARKCEGLLGLGVTGLAEVIGLSVPMLNQAPDRGAGADRQPGRDRPAHPAP